MKKQGKKGAQAMISLIEARVNSELENSLENILKEMTMFPVHSTLNLEVDSKIVRLLFKETKHTSKVILNGTICVDVLTTSYIGRMAKCYC